MKRMIADNIICNQEKNGQSIHSLINLIKEYFLKNEDPYNTWYVYDGIKYQIDYCTLIDIKEIRNTIVHDKGVVNVSRWKNMKLVPIPKGGIVEIDDDLFNRCLIILKAISFRINQLAQKQLSKGLSKKDQIVPILYKYTLPENETQNFASKYKLYLPSEEELSQELQREYRALEYDKKNQNNFT